MAVPNKLADSIFYTQFAMQHFFEAHTWHMEQLILLVQNPAGGIPGTVAAGAIFRLS